jgi:hypothetical protein
MIREEIIDEIKNILTTENDSLGFSTFIHYPTVAAREEDIPCLFMYEGTDSIVHRSTRSKLGYPSIRSLDIIFEILDFSDSIMSRVKNVRDKILENGDSYPQASVEEKSMDGPMGSGIPNIVVCRLTLSASYKDTN